MPGRPNFTDAQINQDTLQVFGTSDDLEPEDILDIRVILTQDAQDAGGSPTIASGSVAELSPSWHADLPSAGFEPGPAMAFGVETRRTNVTTTTWANPVTIH